MVALGRLPFRFSEHRELDEFINIVRLAPSKPKLPSGKTLRRYLQKKVKEKQETLLQKLSPSGKLLIALDCWTSPFNQAFMAITGYFLDQGWNYREILLGFEPLHGTHNGSNLSLVLFEILQAYGIVNTSPRAFWKEHEREFPALSSLARDVLAIPASGAGVERLFNSARDICHYRRGHLKSSTIKDLMMWMCTSKFELEQEQLDLMEEYLLASEVAATEEERAPSQLQTDFQPVSDDEEEDDSDNI
ncbi:uncharacterized protein ATNIH1004_010633 [Aspergillus tanneri]|uniref:HAT C-terminal dimerisation domain-containing protein n=1 Tax=Aspergillus tanneri TaxID=1220188 RepID=A0A5M9MAE3_9EURO|nr:uncharacterized protein ATNIH1004_010633 [Aspergillus tanneri]KAA8643858.1 hypothetical protein ATNIH1004_010633 [Aspergillus tanneri]